MRILFPLQVKAFAAILREEHRSDRMTGTDFVRDVESSLSFLTAGNRRSAHEKTAAGDRDAWLGYALHKQNKKLPPATE